MSTKKTNRKYTESELMYMLKFIVGLAAGAGTITSLIILFKD